MQVRLGIAKFRFNVRTVETMRVAEGSVCTCTHHINCLSMVDLFGERSGCFTDDQEHNEGKQTDVV